MLQQRHVWCYADASARRVSNQKRTLGTQENGIWDSLVLCVQDGSLNPGTGDKVTFHVATHIATARAADKAGGPNSKYAGVPYKLALSLRWHAQSDLSYLMLECLGSTETSKPCSHLSPLSADFCSFAGRSV